MEIFTSTSSEIRAVPYTEFFENDDFFQIIDQRCLRSTVVNRVCPYLYMEGHVKLRFQSLNKFNYSSLSFYPISVGGKSRPIRGRQILVLLLLDHTEKTYCDAAKMVNKIYVCKTYIYKYK